MIEVLKSFQRLAWSIPAMALAAGIAAYTTPSVVGAADSIWGNPCDVRDTCSSDPGKYAAHRENVTVKAREYIGEMRWGTGGAPDDVYVISKTVGSRDFAGAKPCEVRDNCGAELKTWKNVRRGPSVHDVAPVANDDGLILANTTSQE